MALVRKEDEYFTFVVGIFYKIRENDDRYRPYLNIDLYQMGYVVRSFFDDLERIENYHATNDIDLPKRAAYLAKRIIQFSPIYLHECPVEDRRAPSLYFNEVLALRCALEIIEVKTRDGILSAYQLREIVYSLKHRSYSEHGMTMLFRSMMGHRQSLSKKEVSE